MAQDLRTPREAYNRGDYATALREWRPLAEQGNMTAQSFIGMMYLNGNGVPQDYAEAAKWSRRAAVQEDIPAMYNLGVMYARGQGVTQDNVMAHMWLNLAASKGNEGAVESRDLIA